MDTENLLTEYSEARIALRQIRLKIEGILYKDVGIDTLKKTLAEIGAKATEGLERSGGDS